MLLLTITTFRKGEKNSACETQSCHRHPEQARLGILAYSFEEQVLFSPGSPGTMTIHIVIKSEKFVLNKKKEGADLSIEHCYFFFLLRK